MPYIVKFVTTVASDPEKSDSVVASAAGLIGLVFILMSLFQYF